ncbi:hypothetical protein G9A89_021283 [Geosiphon pyriformis]|nr:hypothetical protein G9A89_021283 [Geosiphon pyriformis]
MFAHSNQKLMIEGLYKVSMKASHMHTSEIRQMPGKESNIPSKCISTLIAQDARMFPNFNPIYT